MILKDRVVSAFNRRVMPPRMELHTPSTTEELDLLWFNGQNWRNITFEDWRKHPDAFYFFTPEAFAYYLQSIICISLKHFQEWFYPVDILLSILDRSPQVEYWDDFMLSRVGALYPEEYEVLKLWILWLSENSQIYPNIDLGRVFDTVDLLENQARK